MATFTDDFTRPDSTNLGAGWVEVSGDWSIVSGQLSPGPTGGTIIARAAGAMASSDHFAQVTVAVTASASQGVWCRGNADFTGGYLWRNNGSSWNLFSVVGEEFSFIGSFAAAAAPGDVAKVQAVGSTIKAFVNGVERVSVTDTAVPTGTAVGIRSDAVETLRYDAFSAADFTTGVTGSAGAQFGGLSGAAVGVRTVSGTAAGALGGLTAAANGTRRVHGAAVAQFGGLTAGASGVRKVVGSAVAPFGRLSATATAQAPVTGLPDDEPGPQQGSWDVLLDILREGAQQHREESERLPTACRDCGEPLLTARGVLYCPFDGSTWGAGGRFTGRITIATGRR